MKRYDLQGIDLDVPYEKAFAYIADSSNLPHWTHAFAEVRADGATLRTPNGEVGVGLRVHAARDQGTIDWTMTFPDGSVARAYSRVIDLGGGSSQYSFVLTPPPAPLENLEGILAEQARVLAQELVNLKRNLEHA